MTSTVQNIVVDCADAYGLAVFWSQVVGCPLAEGDQPGDPEAVVVLPSGTALFFAQVPEPKTVKNRLHLCLKPDERREDEVERLLGIGATMVDDRRKPDGYGWAVLADPEGNEFCVLRGPGDTPPNHGWTAPA
ncbi:VOC family protein [Actinokineospora sp. NPDC004072]